MKTKQNEMMLILSLTEQMQSHCKEWNIFLVVFHIMNRKKIFQGRKHFSFEACSRFHSTVCVYVFRPVSFFKFNARRIGFDFERKKTYKFTALATSIGAKIGYN